VSTPTPESPPAPAATPVVAGGRRPNPRWAQYKRTLYFLKGNTLALIGLGIIILIVVVAVYATTQSVSWNALTDYCGTNQVAGGPSTCGPGFPSICTYPAGSAPPGPGCYQTPAGQPSEVAPTWSTHPLTSGPLPLGSLTVNPDEQYFFSTYQGLLRGSDWSLIISVSVVATGATVGLLIGAVSGYLGGTIDEGIMRLVDIFLSIPQVLFVIIFVSVIVSVHPTIFGLSPTASAMIELIVAFIITWWPFYARVVRGQVLVVREQKYVEAAQASGASRGRIIVKHIIPNSVYPVFIQMSLDVGTVPLYLGVLVFLGFHIFPNQFFPEWGSITALSVVNLTGFLTTCQLSTGCVIPWWQLLFPGLALFLYAISVNFLSDGLRDALDPRLRR
jgi:peptide/nickel transport system permease protein